MRAHQPGDAIFTAGQAAGLQFLGHARAAVADGFPLAELLDFFQQPGVGLLAGRGLALAPRIIAGAAHGKGRTQRAQGMLCGHGLNALIAIGHVVETMPKVFFRMSRCWRN